MITKDTPPGARQWLAAALRPDFARAELTKRKGDPRGAAQCFPKDLARGASGDALLNGLQRDLVDNGAVPGTPALMQ